MAYRIEQNISWRDMWENLHTFLTELTNIYDVSYVDAQGDGIFEGLSVPSATSTTETWTLICTDASYPQTFSIQGSVTGNTAAVTVGVPYNNGIVWFTLADGANPWEINDIISFSTESTTTPPWKSMGPSGEPVRAVCRFSQKSTGLYTPIRGQFLQCTDGPKTDSCAFVASRAGKEGTGNPKYYNWSWLGADDFLCYPPTPKNNWSITFWLRKDCNIYSHAYDAHKGYGEFMHPVTSNTNVVGSVGLFTRANSVGIHAIANSYEYKRIDKEFNAENFYLTNPLGPDDWVLYSYVFTGDTLEVFANTTSLGTYTDDYVAQLDWGLYSLSASSDLADLISWDKSLTLSDISDIVASPTRPNIEDPEIIDGFTFNPDDVMPKIMVKNEDAQGNNVSAVFDPQNEPYFSYKVSMSFRGIHRYKDVKQEDIDFLIKEPSEERQTPSEWPCETYNYLLGAEPSHIIEKYWFVASNEFIIVAYKTYDPSTQQQLPVYQIGYIGKSKTSEEHAYKVHLGTYSAGNDYWYTGSASFRSGIFYATHATWLGHFLYMRPAYINVSPIASGFLEIENSYNVYPIMHEAPEGTTPAWTWTPANPSTYPTQMNQNYGEFHNISGIQTTNVTLEDEVIIDGVRHVALGDTTRAGSTSLILLKLD